jgi:rRNA maturation protein Nop10
MHLMYCEVCTKYTLKKVCECNKPTRSAHPGQWSGTQRKRYGTNEPSRPASTACGDAAVRAAGGCPSDFMGLHKR